MVGVDVLLVVGRLAELRVEVGRQADGALARPPEGVEAEFRVRLDAEVAEVVAEQDVLRLGVPEGVAAQLPFRAGIQVHGVLHVVDRPDGGAVEILLQIVSDADVELGHDALAGPGLQPEVELVVQAHHAHRVGAGPAVAEDVVVEGGSGGVADGVGVVAHVGGELAAVTDEGGGDVLVLGVEGVGAVLARPPLVDEVERDAQLLVQEDGILLEFGPGAGHDRLDVAAVHRGVPDPADVGDAAVLMARDHVVDVARVHGVALAQVVGLDHAGLVDGRLVRQDAASAVAVEQQAEVQRGRNVLGGEDVEVVGLLLVAGEQGAEVPELRVGDLGVPVRERAVRVAPGLQGVIELHPLVAAALEPVVALERGAGDAQPGGVDVLAQEGVVVETVVVGRVRDPGRELAEIGVLGPGDEALVQERIRQGVGVEDAGSRLEDAVADVLALLLDLVERIGLGDLPQDLLVQVVFLALLFGQPGVPGLEFRLGPGQGVGDDDRVDLVPHRGVEQGPERVARVQTGRERVHDGLHRECVGIFGLGAGVAHGDLLQLQRPAKLVSRHGVDYGILCRRDVILSLSKDLHAVLLHWPPISGTDDPRGGKYRHGHREAYAREKIHNLQRYGKIAL